MKNTTLRLRHVILAIIAVGVGFSVCFFLDIPGNDREQNDLVEHKTDINETQSYENRDSTILDSMKITDVSKQDIVETPHKVDVRKLYDKESAQVMHITLKPGEALKPHITPVDVFFYVLEGTVDIRVGDKTVPVDKDILVESPKDIVHNISNNSDIDARIMVVKAPRPTSKTKLL